MERKEDWHGGEAIYLSEGWNWKHLNKSGWLVMKNTRSVKITRIKDGSSLVVEDEIIVDTYLTISVNGRRIASFICSPGYEQEAAIGYLFSTGILASVDRIKGILRKEYNIDVETTETTQTYASSEALITSACGVPEEWLRLRKGFRLPGIQSALKVNSTTVTAAIALLNDLSETFRRTGGTHAAALFRPDGRLICNAEDVSRHVAVDKVIGRALLSRNELKESFLVTTGRLAGDMVAKAVYAGIPLVASMAAPFSSGIQLAEATGITLVGFVRGQRMNLYAHPERVTVES